VLEQRIAQRQKKVQKIEALIQQDLSRIETIKVRPIVKITKGVQ
jgi:hypothetical protein